MGILRDLFSNRNISRHEWRTYPCTQGIIKVVSLGGKVRLEVHPDNINEKRLKIELSPNEFDEILDGIVPCDKTFDLIAKLIIDRKKRRR